VKDVEVICPSGSHAVVPECKASAELILPECIRLYPK
jgi:hypothetical protein